MPKITIPLLAILSILAILIIASSQSKDEPVIEVKNNTTFVNWNAVAVEQKEQAIIKNNDSLAPTGQGF